MTQAANNLAAKYWGNQRPDGKIRSWLSHPLIKEEINRRISGESDVSWFNYVKKNYFIKPVNRSLSLACGFGALERYLVTSNVCQIVEGVDISDEALAFAIAESHRVGLSNFIKYRTEDLNEIKLNKYSYDAIWNISASHHVDNLDNLFSQCARALTKNGLLVTNEYVGPSRFQADPHVIEIINALLDCFPDKYKVNLGRQGVDLIRSFSPPSLDWFQRNDPSEAIRSHEIIPTLEKYFDIKLFRPYGGTILHFLLSGIAGNFTDQDDANAIIKILIIFENELLRSGVIKNDHAVIVATPRLDRDTS